jgi:hypothetical protein
MGFSVQIQRITFWAVQFIKFMNIMNELENSLIIWSKIILAVSKKFPAARSQNLGKKIKKLPRFPGLSSYFKQNKHKEIFMNNLNKAENSLNILN